jgi:hypothetical protein
VGYSSAYTATSYLTSPADPRQVLTAASTYRWRVRAQNTQGWGDYSSPISILAAGVPSQMAMVTVTDNPDSPTIRIAWTKPSENGSPVAAYEVKMLSKTAGVYFEALGVCDGSSASVMTNLYCDVPMATLVSDPFLLT